jgi:DNA ligase-1
MAKRTFVQLAHKYSDRSFIAAWYMSEKLDGMRCFWDGGITRGMIKSEVPWANCAKDDRLKNVEVSTGLWSRLGNVVHAPDWWINHLPKVPLDGELWRGHEPRQDLMSRIKRLVPRDADWEDVNLWCYGMPSLEEMFPEHFSFYKDLPLEYRPKPTLTFRQEYFLLKKWVKDGMSAKVLPQYDLSFNHSAAKKQVAGYCDQVVAQGGEGVMLRDPNTSYECCRSHNLLKVKPFDDMEGTIIGYITGRETDKGSKLLGLMGAMVLRLDSGVELELSGFSNEERVLDGFHHGSGTRAKHWAENNPETECPLWIECKHFKRGERVTLKYRGLTKDGVPQEARYFRKDERI